MNPGCYRLINSVQAQAPNPHGIIPDLRSGIADGIYINSRGTWLGVVVPVSSEGLAVEVGQQFTISPYFNEQGDYIPAGDDVKVGEYLGAH